MKIMAVDLGLARTGLAISDLGGSLASPAGTICEEDSQVLLAKILAVVSEQHVQKIIVGHPRNMDGTSGESALRAEEFAEALRDGTEFPVFLWDERLTTVSANHYLNQTNVRGKKRKALLDTVAATIILQEYLDSHVGRE